MLPGGSGIAPPLRATWQARHAAISPASRVSISEVLCVNNLSADHGRQGTRAHRRFSQAPAAAAPSKSEPLSG